MLTTNYHFVCAKLRGMRRKMFERASLARLCECRRLEDVARETLPEHAAGDPLTLERYLTEAHVARLFSLAPLLGGRSRDLFLWLMRHYQLENLKVILRCWANREPRAALARYTVRTPPTLGLPVDRLMEASDLAAFAAAVPVPSFRLTLERLSQAHQNTEDLYAFQAALDRDYFAELLRLADSLARRQRLPTLPLVRFHAAIYDLLVLARGRLNYSLSFEDLVRPLVEVGEMLRKRQRRQIAAADGLDEVLDALPRQLRIAPPAESTLENLERALWTRLYRLANLTFYTSLFDLGAVVAFYYLKRIELANLVRLLQMVRRGVPPDEIRAAMIPPLA